MPFRSMAPLTKDALANDKEVRFDSGIAVSLASVTAGVESINEKIKNIEADLVKISLNSSNPSEDDNGGKEDVESVSSQLAKLTFFQ